jgi:hypothetical protein
MKIVKTRLRNRMEDDFIANYLIVYIEKEIVERFTIKLYRFCFTTHVQ